MSTLVSILCDIVQAEYAQWMRYTFLSALRYGLHTDTLQEHFEEHANDELEHAQLISRWIVDLGGLPPTTIPCIEQIHTNTQEALEWLLNAEVEGINKYQAAHCAAEGIFGLQNDIGELLSIEHEHLSDIMKFLEPISEAISEDDEDTIIILANSYRQHRDVLYKFASIKKYAQSMTEYLRDLLQMAWYKHEYDYTPEKGLEYVRDDTKKTLMTIHERLREGDQSARQSAKFFIDLYQWLQPMNKDAWLQLHYKIWPEYHTDPAWGGYEGVEEAIEEKVEKPTFEQALEETKEEVKKPTSLPQPAPQVSKPPARSPELMEAMEKRIEVYDAGKSNDPSPDVMFTIGPGDRIKNMDLAGEGIPVPGRPGRSAWTEGTVKHVTRGGILVVDTPKGEQSWDPAEHRIEIDARDRAKYLSQGKLVKQSD